MNPAIPASAHAAEQIEPLFFPGPNGRLFACLHKPPQGETREPVVLCPPTGHEYAQSHRALRQLAARLARQGRCVLRFDYFGSGDSEGEPEAAAPSLWVEDVRAALEQCKGFSRHERIGVIGARLGGTLAACAALNRTDLAWLVLWSPVADGRRLVAEWAAEQRAYAEGRGLPWSALQGERLGFPWPERLETETAALRLPAGPLGGARLLIAHAPAETAEADALAQALAAFAPVQQAAAEDAFLWGGAGSLDLTVPGQTLRKIVDWVETCR